MTHGMTSITSERSDGAVGMRSEEPGRLRFGQGKANAGASNTFHRKMPFFLGLALLWPPLRVWAAWGVVALLVAPAGAKVDAALSTQACAVAFEPLTGDRVPKWVVHHVDTVLHSTITPSAVDLLISAVGNDLPQLASELDKLASYANGAAIDDEAVSAIVGVRRGETLGDLLDRVLAHDAPGALAVIDHVLAQPKVTAVSIVMALTTQMLAVAWARAARDRGFPAVGIDRELFALLKESSPYTGRPWGEAVSAWSRAVPAWRQSELDAAIDALLAADYALKESRLSSDEQIIGSLVLTLCGAPRRAAA